MFRPQHVFAAALVLAGALATFSSWADDQTVPGIGNATAAALASASPLVRTALQRIESQLAGIQDSFLRQATADAVLNPRTCIAHRAGLDGSAKQAVLAALDGADLLDPAEAASIPGGVLAGVFPPVLEDGSSCPHLPLAFGASPGSGNASHHSYPGGLAVHESFNLASDLSFAENYRLSYGQPGADGLPRTAALHQKHAPRASDLDISQDTMIAAPVWHDWAKPLVFQWTASGTEFAELNFGGNGQTDNGGQAGDSRTGGHHILSLAESIARGLPAAFIVTQASAHSAPTLGNEYKVVNWIRAAAIIARVDPVAKGYLTHADGQPYRLAPMRRAGEIDLNAAGQTNLLVEYALHNLSDADFVFSIPAVTEAQVVLAALAPRYGYDPVDAARYNTQYRNPAFSYISPERLLILYTNHGIDSVRAELDRLRALHVL